MPSSASTPATPTVSGFTANASARVRCFTSIAWGAGTTEPEGSATTTVMPEPGGKLRWPKPAKVSFDVELVQPAVLPGGPLKHAIRWTGAGAWTATSAVPIGTDHWCPIASQFN